MDVDSPAPCTYAVTPPIRETKDVLTQLTENGKKVSEIEHVNGVQIPTDGTSARNKEAEESTQHVRVGSSNCGAVDETEADKAVPATKAEQG